MKRNRLIFTAIAGGVALAFAACGGVDSDLVGAGSDGGSSSGDGSNGDGSSGGRDSGGRDGSRSDSGPNADGGGGKDGGSGGDGGHSNIVQCGTNGTTTGTGTPVSCNATSPVCCASQYPYDTTPQSYSCTPNAAACVALDAGSIPIPCRSNADCSGATQCCGHEIADNIDPFNPTFIYGSVHCQASCPLTFPDGGETEFRLFCDPAAIPSVCTVPGQSCVASTLLPGFNVCGTP